MRLVLQRYRCVRDASGDLRRALVDGIVWQPVDGVRGAKFALGKGGEGERGGGADVGVVIGAVALGCASRERLQSEGQRSAVGVGHGDGNGGEGGGDETGGDEGSAADVRVRGIRKDASRGKLEDGLGEERAFVRVLGMSDALSEGVEDLTVYHGVHSVERVRRVGFEIEPVDRRLYERTQKAIADDVTLRRQRARGLRARARIEFGAKRRSVPTLCTDFS